MKRKFVVLSLMHKSWYNKKEGLMNMVGYNGYEYLSFKRAENTATHN